jgi:hypothetical protein
VEAQAVGLKSLVAASVTSEMDITPGLVHRLPITEPATVWAEHVLRLFREPETDACACLRAVAASPFNITNSARSLMDLYSGA